MLFPIATATTRRNINKFIHTTYRTCFASEKSHLATLRKKTGYTFSNCKKALEMHNNDLQEAEKWLKKQAQELGWSKATKLEGRQTSQGLIGVVVDGNTAAAMVEINCETDFVARNHEFQKMVREAADCCLEFVRNTSSDEPLCKMNLNGEKLRNLQTKDGKRLADQLALMIGTLGENATLKRALCIKSQEDNIILNGYAHPSGLSNNNVLLGRFAGLVAFKSHNNNNNNIENIEEITKGICQHVVGMSPTKIGIPDEDEPSPNKDEENCLIFQEYLLDDNLTVKELLQENELEIVDFKRFECGENDDSTGQPLELLETCQ